ncbi:MAG: glycerophosphoryl diester phosphodiesterase [Pseudomonadales bacterium]
MHIPKIMAHRGLSSLAPENSLSALRLAAEHGAKWVEIDAIACGDNTIVTWHDNSVDRCSDGSGSMAEHTAQSIQSLDCGSWFGEAYSGEKMATIEQAIVLIKELGMGLNLEFKLYDNSPEKVVAPVLELLKKHWDDNDKLIISSFDLAALQYCREQDSQLKLGRLYDEIPDNWADELTAIQAVSLHCNYKHLREEQARAVKAAGYALLCYTPNDPAEIEQFWGWGMDSAITDYPQRYAQLKED